MRIRVLAALFALLAFSASFAEGVWASTCPEGGRANSASHAGMEMGMVDDGAPVDPAPHDTPARDTDCPLPVIASSGCVIVSLPAPTVQVDLSGAVVRMVPTGSADFLDRLTISSLFRPPQP